MSHDHWHLPTFWWRGRRWRVRWRFVGAWLWYRHVYQCKEGDVVSVRLGWLLVVAMVDGGGNGQP